MTATAAEKPISDRRTCKGSIGFGPYVHVVSRNECVSAQVHIITAACENMIDGRGLRPGDILQAANGKTVEVGPPKRFPGALRFDFALL